MQPKELELGKVKNLVSPKDFEELEVEPGKNFFTRRP